MKLYELRDVAGSSGRLVFTVGQLANLASIPRSHAKVYAARLVGRGMAWRVRRGVISLTRDTFIIATQLVEPSYISFHSALYLRGLADQVPSVVECVTTRRTARFEGLGLVYRRVHPALFFGYERVERGGSYVFVATPEKAVLDMVYFGLDPGSVPGLDHGRLARMAEAYRAVGGYRARRVLRWLRCCARRS
jgi:predicted transcriptional regulator of viral defense system